MRPQDATKKVLARALELDNTIGEAYDTLGVLSWISTGTGTLPIAHSAVPSLWRELELRA